MIVIGVPFFALIIVFSKVDNLNYHLLRCLFKCPDLILIRYILRLKFSNLFMQFQILFLQFNNIKLKFWIAYFKLRSKALWAFQRRFPQGLSLRIRRYSIHILVS